MKKIFISGTIAAICIIAVSIVVGLIFNQLFPSVKAEYENMNIFRAMNDPLMYIYFIEPFILSFVLAWIWNRTMLLFKGSVAKRAFYFSFIYWMVASLPGLIMSVSSFKISVLLTFTWLVSSFVQAWVASLIIIRMNK